VQGSKVWAVNQYQKDFDLALKIIVYGMVALWFLGFLKFLPDDLSDKIVNLLLGRIGLGK
jgi:hypothetical protein